ncbi:MAG TPA: tRNA pseudouridine(55) synthase TruB, partial [Solirubrobacteraceae bacterium]|nr:tRNA pseudouridine(55) synthase TruB [Solirubrobacteraceae bacterium]
ELWRERDRAAFRIVCSSGTYVRSLIGDLGDAYCLELRRTAIGPFEVAGGWPGQGRAEVLDLAPGLGRFMPVVALDAAGAQAAAHGRPVPGEAGPGGAVLLVDGLGPIAVAEDRGGGELKPVVGFRG